MANKLYLVRRNLETIYGPMNFDEFRRGFEHMEFGLQDEISGHCRTWVFLENGKALKTNYPEIHKYVFQNLNTWSDSLQHNSFKRGINRSMLRSKQNKVFATLLVIFVFLLIFYARKEGVFNSRKDEFSAKDAVKMLRQEKYAHLDDKIKSMLPQILSTQKKGGEFFEWLPVLRWYAFQGNGEIPGIPGRIIRGVAADHLPEVCSYSKFRNLYLKSVPKWQDFLVKKELIEESWAQILSWDPHWIKRRVQAGWIKPESYPAACISMGLQVFSTLHSDSEFTETIAGVYGGKAQSLQDTIKNRFAWISYIVNSTSKPHMDPLLPKKNLTDQWSCMEAATNLAQLTSCHESTKKDKDGWRAYGENRFLFNLVRLLVHGSEDSRKKILADFFGDQNPSVFTATDPFNSSDLRAELTFLRTLLRENGDKEKSFNRVRIEHLEVDLSREYTW